MPPKATAKTTTRTRWINETFHPDWQVRLRADKILHEMKTKHQHLVIFENDTWGTVLMLDGVVQLTTSDDFVYHEMMAHVPLRGMVKSKVLDVFAGMYQAGGGKLELEDPKEPSLLDKLMTRYVQWRASRGNS